LIFKLPVVQGGEKLGAAWLSSQGFKARKRGFMRGWEREFKQGKVFFTGSNFLLFSKQVYAFSPLEAVEKGLKTAERVGLELQRVFPSVEISCDGEVVRQQLALKGGLTAWIPKGFSFVGDRLIIDFSDGSAEIESYGKFTLEGMSNVASFLDDVAKGSVSSVKVLEVDWRDRT
jgi:hypothetical protein